MLQRFILALAMLWVPTYATAQTTISIRPSARLATDAQQVRLDDIADITPHDAALAETIVLDNLSRSDGQGWIKIDTESIRAALEGTHINWGKTSIRGGTCTVRLSEAKLATREVKSTRSTAATQPTTVELSGPVTIKTMVTARLAALYKVEAHQLKLGFDGSDAGLLSTLVGDREVEIEPGGLGTSTRLPINITLYEGDRVVVSGSIRVEAMVYRPQVTAAMTIERGRTITDDQLSIIERWQSPGSKPMVSEDELVGAIARKRIASGEIIEAGDAEPPLACKRGDTVFVHCVSGNVVVKIKARAMASARDGELVKLKSDSSAEPFLARMSGRGRAVLRVSGDPEGELDTPTMSGPTEVPAVSPTSKGNQR